MTTKPTWQPIETAPKDGQEFLVLVNSGKRDSLSVSAMWWNDTEELFEDWDHFWNDSNMLDLHGWIPLPELKE